MLINYAIPRFQSLKEEFIFQQDGAPTTYSYKVKAYFNRKVPMK